jgi:hypothetical protein
MSEDFDDLYGSQYLAASDNAFGKDFDDWVDKRITVKAERTQFAGKPVMGLRLYPEKKALGNELNDSLPDDL